MNANALATASSEDDTLSPFIGLAPLMRKAFSGVDIKPIGAQLIQRAEKYPNDAHALMDLSTVLQLTGNRDLAMTTQMEALQLQQIYHVPATHQCNIRLLALMAHGDLMANTPLEFLVENSDIALDMMYVGEGIPAVDAVPDHDVLFVAIGECDENRALLKGLEPIIQSWPRPVINKPEHIARLGRDTASTFLQSTDKIVMPQSVRIDRHTVEKIGADELAVTSIIQDGDFPIILRPVGSHAGNGLRKIPSADAIPDYLQAVPSDEFYMARFVDYRSTDGMFRKYRIILIEGRPFICHMGISSHWMIHYLNAGMTESAEKRAEEERCMITFDEDFAARHQEAFRILSERLGFDYIGIDCGETQDGKLLIFEVDSDMIVHAMDPVDLFPYKQPQMQKLFTAFREMLVKAITSNPVA